MMMGGMSGGDMGVLPLLLSEAGLDLGETLLLLQMMGGGEVGDQMGSVDPMMMYFLLKNKT